MAGQNPEQYDVFLSYAREDAARIRPLVSALEAEGWTIFWDRRIPPAESWRSYIGLRLRTASVVVVVWSEYSTQSDWVITEAEEAHRRRALVPTSIDAVDAPLGLNQIQAADLVEWIAGGGGALPEDLRAAIQRRIPANVGTRAASSGDSIESTSESKGKVGEEHQEAARMLPSKAPQQITSAENDEVGGIDIHAPELASVQRKPRTAVYAGVLALFVAVAASAYGIFATVAPRQQERQQAELASPQRVAAAAEEARLKAEAEAEHRKAEEKRLQEQQQAELAARQRVAADAEEARRKAEEKRLQEQQQAELAARQRVAGDAEEARRKAEAERQRIADEAATQGDKYYFGRGSIAGLRPGAVVVSQGRRARKRPCPDQPRLYVRERPGRSAGLRPGAVVVSQGRRARERQCPDHLGLMYASGQGVSQDYAQALSWYRKAAEQGYAPAQANLGVMYANGRGVAQDYAQALSWFRKAAEQGDAVGQNGLGVVYANGRGVAQDYAQALSWFRKAAEQGYAAAQSNLGIMYGNGQGVAQDYAQALSWNRKAAEQGDAGGQNSLGLFTSKAMAYHRTTPRRCRGIARPPSKGTPLPSTTSA